MRLLAIDPGTTESAFVEVDGMDIIRKGKVFNEEMLGIISIIHPEEAVIEMVASYGMPVGAEVFETCVWIGQFMQEIYHAHLIRAQKMYRKEVKLHLCGVTKAKDANIRQAILDKYPRTGGGKTPQIGTKKQPGPLYGVKADIWAALGVALTYQGL